MPKGLRRFQQTRSGLSSTSRPSRARTGHPIFSNDQHGGLRLNASPGHPPIYNSQTGDVTFNISNYADGSGISAAVDLNSPTPAFSLSDITLGGDLPLSPYARQVFQQVAQDTRSLPWLCNASATLRAQVPRTPFSVGLKLDRRGFGATGRVGATTPFGGAFFTTNGKTIGTQFSAPISPILNATVSTASNQFTVGLSRRFQFGGQMSAGGSLTFGYLGDSGCR